MITLTIIILTIIGLVLGTILMLAAGVAVALVSFADILVAVGIIYLVIKFLQKQI